MEKLIITAAVNGAEVTRTHTPHVPLAPQEIADAAVAAAEAGAAMVHVHARRIRTYRSSTWASVSRTRGRMHAS